MAGLARPRKWVRVSPAGGWRVRQLCLGANLPTAALLYGGSQLIFAAKEAVEKKVVARGIQIGRAQGKVQGRAEGRQEERERIRQKLAAAGLHLTPEQERVLSQNCR